MSPPGVSADGESLGGKQRQLQRFLDRKEKRRILQKLTQIGGVQRYKDELPLTLTRIDPLVLTKMDPLLVYHNGFYAR